MRIMGRATGSYGRTGSGTSAHTSGCVCTISGIRSTVAASAFSPRSRSPASTSAGVSARSPIRRQCGHSPQKSSRRRSQVAACAKKRASVYLPTPRGPVKSSALGTRSRRSIARSAFTIRSLPRNALNPMRSAPGSRARKHAFVHDGQNLPMNFVRGAQPLRVLVEAFDSRPTRVAREVVVDRECRAQVSGIRFLNISPQLRIFAGRLLGDQVLCFLSGHAEVNRHVFRREPVYLVFELSHPGEKYLAALRRHSRALVRKVGSDVAVGQENLSLREIGFAPFFCLQAIPRVEQHGKVRVHGVQRAECAVQELRGHLAEKAGIVWEAEPGKRELAGFEGAREEIELRAFPRAINPFEDN